jgi:transposase-like protein
MEDYPRDLADLEARFGEESACLDYLEKLKWPNGFICSRCGSTQGWPLEAGRYECVACKRQSSVTAGTLFHRTRTPLPVWFRAIWWVVCQKNGVSALGLKRVLGIGSYETVWMWMHKLRRAMVNPEREKLTGEVEVDETILGKAEEGVSGRQTNKKPVIVIAAECCGQGIGRIRMKRIPDASADSLLPFITENVTPGTQVRTDGWKGYCGLEALGYPHERIPLRGDRKKAFSALPRVHRVAGLLQRWLLGTHHGAISPEHLGYYLDEFTFRFNRRTSRSRGKLFFRLMQNAVAMQGPDYQSVVKHVRGPKRADTQPQHVVPT